MTTAAETLPESATSTRRPWTTSEDRTLRELYPRETPARCAEVLGRSLGSVYNRASTLKLRAANAGEAPSARRRHSSSEWLDRQIVRLYQTARTGGEVQAFATRVGRPRWWISKRATQLGVVVPRFRTPEWSEEEIELLHAWQGQCLAVIRKRLARRGFTRSETAIQVKLKRLHISPNLPNTVSAHELSKLMGVDGKTVTRWIHTGLLEASRRGTKRTEAQGGDEWLISHRAIRLFCQNHPVNVDLCKVDRFWFIDVLTGRD